MREASPPSAQGPASPPEKPITPVGGAHFQLERRHPPALGRTRSQLYTGKFATLVKANSLRGRPHSCLKENFIQADCGFLLKSTAPRVKRTRTGGRSRNAFPRRNAQSAIPSCTTTHCITSHLVWTTNVIITLTTKKHLLPWHITFHAMAN